MNSKVEFTDEELAQISELVRENFEVYGYDPDSHTGCCRAFSGK